MSEAFRRALKHDDNCPPAEVLLVAMEDGAQGHEAIAEHVKLCPACQSELALFKGFEAGEVRPDEREAVKFIVSRLQGEARASVVPDRPAKNSFWPMALAFFTPVRTGALAAATAAILIAAGLSLQWQNRPGTSHTLSEEGGLRSEAIRGILPQGDVVAFPSEIQWDAAPAAAEYEVTIREVDRNVIFHKKFTTPLLHVPADVRRLMLPGKTVLLEISAKDASGRPVAQSETTRIHVRPSPKQSH